MAALDDVSQTSFYIPFTPDKEESTLDKLQDACLRAYRTAWDKCLGRVESIAEKLYAPTIASIVQHVSTCYEDLLPGLPYAELPVITINNVTSGSLFPNELLNQISRLETVIVTHLYPSDISNLSAGMKNLISGFLEANTKQLAKGRVTRTTAVYDINILHTWYKEVKDEYGSHFQLLVILHDFEQFDTNVMQDIFYICSSNVPELPLAFMLLLSSPTSPSYIHATYPRMTLTRLRIQSFTAPTGRQALEELLLQTFFSLDFDPDLMIGPAALASIVDHYTRHHSSTDTFLMMLQLAHLKHFLTEPLSLLVHPPTDLVSDSTYNPVLESLRTRLAVSQLESYASDDTLPPKKLLSILSQTHASFLSKTHKIRIGFALLHTIQSFLESKGYKGLGWRTDPNWGGLTSVMVDVLYGRVGRDVKTLGLFIKKLRPAMALDLLKTLHDLFFSMPVGVRKKEEDARIQIATYRSMDPEALSCEDVGEWLVAYMQQLFQPLESHELWDVWYTGLSPFPSEVFNPSIRASLVSALLHPNEFSQPIPTSPLNDSTGEVPPSPTVSDLQMQLEPHNNQRGEKEQEYQTPALWDLPDTSILFRRYLDSGKLINVYDWYESFKAALDTQQEVRLASLRARQSRSPKKGRRKSEKSKSKSKSPTKRSTKVKGQASAEEEAAEEPDEERWVLEVQARFIRAMHELDYLGFLKHTGRRAEHVVRVVFDVGDEGDE